MKQLIQKINTPEFFDGWIQDQNEDKEIEYFLDSPFHCSFGTRITWLFRNNREFSSLENFNDLFGETWFYDEASELGWSEVEVNFAFYVAGASPYPFSTEKWRLPCKKVLNNLLAMEKPPTEKEVIYFAKKNKDLKRIKIILKYIKSSYYEGDWLI